MNKSQGFAQKNPPININCDHFIYISRRDDRIHGSRSPHTLPALWTDVPEARAPDSATRDEWLNFTKGQGSRHILYPTLALETDAWCQFPCVGTGKVTANPLTHQRLPHGAAISSVSLWTVNLQNARYQPQIICPQRTYRLSSIHPHPALPRPVSPQTPTKAIHLWKEAHNTRRGSSYISICDFVGRRSLYVLAL